MSHMGLLALMGLGLLLFIVGMFLMMLGALREASKAKESGQGGEEKVEAGGVVLIGPVPIVFGTSQRIAKIVLILAIVLTILALVLFLIAYV